jgi:hypothetical protein
MQAVQDLADMAFVDTARGRVSVRGADLRGPAGAMSPKPGPPGRGARGRVFEWAVLIAKGARGQERQASGRDEGLG